MQERKKAVARRHTCGCGESAQDLAAQVGEEFDEVAEQEQQEGDEEQEDDDRERGEEEDFGGGLRIERAEIERTEGDEEQQEDDNRYPQQGYAPMFCFRQIANPTGITDDYRPVSGLNYCF